MSVFPKKMTLNFKLILIHQTFNSLMNDSYTDTYSDFVRQSLGHSSVLNRNMHAFKQVCSNNIEYSDNTVVYNTCKLVNNDMMIRSKRKSHDYDSHQLCFFIYLLVKTGYDITIQHTYKKSNKTDQVVRIKSVFKGEQQKFSDVMFDTPEYEYNGDLKRRRRNIDAITNNILLSLLEQEYASFSTKKCKELKTITFNATEGKRRLKWLEYEERVYEKSDIDFIGKEIYNFLLNRIKKHDYIFTKNDLFLIKSNYIQKLLIDPSSNSL